MEKRIIFFLQLRASLQPWLWVNTLFTFLAFSRQCLPDQHAIKWAGRGLLSQRGTHDCAHCTQAVVVMESVTFLRCDYPELHRNVDGWPFSFEVCASLLGLHAIATSLHLWMRHLQGHGEGTSIFVVNVHGHFDLTEVIFIWRCKTVRRRNWGTYWGNNSLVVRRWVELIFLEVLCCSFYIQAV